MSEIEGQEDTNGDLPPTTLPSSLNIGLQGFETEEAARTFGNVLATCLRTLGSVFNLERLDGVTVAYNYADALKQLDRGFTATKPLTPSTGIVHGVGMAPSVLRSGVVKKHMMLDASAVRVLEDESNESWQSVLYLIAHECGHVHDLRALDTAFPGIALKKAMPDYESSIRQQFIETCWDEYIACRLSARFGPDVRNWYDQTFTKSLKTARENANQAIRDYREHGDHGQVLQEVTQEYGNLMKFGAYLLGHLAGEGAGIDATSLSGPLLEGHWFQPFFVRMSNALDDICKAYGKWSSTDDFAVLGQIGIDVMKDGGVIVTSTASGGVHIDVPFTADTVP